VLAMALRTFGAPLDDDLRDFDPAPPSGNELLFLRD
jgi:hypothetical protein